MRKFVFGTSIALRSLVPWIYPWAIALALASCSGSINPVGGLLETDVETLPDQVVEEDETSPIVAGFKARSKAPDGTVEVTATSSDTNLMPHPTVTLNSETNTYSLAMIPTGNGSGLVTITVTVTLGSRVKQKTFTVNVIGVSHAPVIEAIADISIEQGSTLSGIELGISDRETAATSLLVSVTSNNQTLLPDANIVLSGTGENRFLALDPIPIQNGVAVVSITVTDSDGLSSVEEFIVTVPAAGGGGGGTPPTITPIADQTINEDSSTGSLAFTVGDADQSANTLIVSVTSSNLTLAPLSAITLTGTAASRTVSVTPPANTFGTSTITISVTDGLLVTQETFLLTVNSVNDAPTITDIANQSVAANTSTGTVAFNISDIETALASLTVTATSSNTTLIPNVNLTLGGTGASRNISAMPATNKYGTSTITVTVNDGTTTTQDTFTVTVAEPEQTSIAFTYPHKDGFKIGESDDQAYTIHGTCAIDDVPVRFSINSGAQTASTSCTSGEWALTMNVAGLADGTITVATTNATSGNNKTRTFVKETAYCDAGKLAASPFAAGTGTRSDPFTVCTLAQFNQIASAAADSTFLVKNNIDFTSAGNWGALSPPGDIDGNNFQLKNITMNTGSGYSGVFSIWNGSRPIILKNIHLYNVAQNTSGGPYIGTLASRIGGGAWHRVYNCSSHGTINNFDDGEIGGLIGWFVAVGGLGRIENSFSQVDFSTSNGSVGAVGGLVGNNDGAEIIRSASVGIVIGGDNTGGIVGTGSSNPITESYSLGSVSHVNTSKSYLGGLVGHSQHGAVFKDSFTRANVSGGNFVGGFSGFRLDSSLRIFSAGTVTGTGTVGGLGTSNNGGAPTNGFWDTQTSGQAASPSGGTGLTTTQMQAQGNFTGFDFSASGPWQMDSSLSPYPTLKWQSNPGAPTITTIADQTIDQGQATGALTFTIADETVAASALTVTAYSTNTTLVPNGNITLGGTGANRTVVVTPDQLQSGTAWIFVDVSDGSLSDFAYFRVTVNPAQLQLTWIYPHQDGFKIGESDDQAYTITGKCLVNGLNVAFTVNSGAVTGTAPCASGKFSYTFNASSLADGTITVATTNGSNGVNISRSLTKETTYCDAGKLAASPYAAGTGTGTDPYTICTPTQLAAMSSNPTSRFELKNNIDLTAFGAWTAPSIQRELEGNNFQIKNFTYPGSGNHYFFTLGTSASRFVLVKNLHVFNATATGLSAGSTALMFGATTGSYLQYGRFYNLSVNGTITSSGHEIAGVANIIPKSERIHSSVNVTSTSGSASGICGYSAEGIQQFSSNSGNITGVYGVSGICSDIYMVQESFNTGNITGSGGGDFAAGISSNFSNLSNSYNWGTVTGTSALGGLASDYFGGGDPPFGIQSSYSIGGVNNSGGATNINGLAGPAFTATNSYWNTQTSGQAASGTGTGLTTSQMQLQASYTGFDFSATGPWQMNSSLSPYPTLKWQSNQPPTITQIADQSINEDSNSGALAFTLGDDQTAVGSLTLTATSLDTTLIPNAAIVFGGSGANRTLTITPVAGRSGTTMIGVQVSDGQLTNFISVGVTVNNTDDDPPIITWSGQQNPTRLEDATGNFSSIEIWDDTVAVGSLTVTLTSDNQTLFPDGNISITSNGNYRYLNGSLAANQSGTATLTLTVSDGTNPNVQTMNLTVTAVNDAASSTLFGIQSTAEDTTLGPVAFTVSDIDTDVNNFTITAISSSASTTVPLGNISFGVTGANRTVTITPVANSTGSSIVTYRISDGSQNTDLAFLMGFTAVNDAPTITDIANQTINEEGNTGALAFTIGDIETVATSLSVSATSSDQTLLPNANLVIVGTGASRTITATPAANQNGTATVTVTVGDGTTTTNDTFTVTVNSVNDAPTLSAIANQAIDANSWTGALAFTVNDLETTAASLTLSKASTNLTLVPTANIVFGGSGANRTVTVTPVANETGTATITVTVSDGNLTANEVFDVTVNTAAVHTAVTFTYPFKDGLRIGESDDEDYTIEGTCSNNGTNVNLSVNNGALFGVAACASNIWSHDFDFSSLADGIVTIATTNSTAAKTLRMFKDTAYCTTPRKAASPFAGGTGDPWDPYTICTPTQFQQISTAPTKNISVRNNLDLSSLTTGEGGLTGTLNGNNFQVKNFTINTPGSSYVQMLNTNPGGIIANLHVRDFTISGNAWVAVFNSYTDGGLIDNVSATGNLTCASGNCGALYGESRGAIVKNSYVKINSSVLSSTSGGLGGSAWNGTRVYRSQAHITSNGRTTFSRAASGHTAISILESFSTGLITTDQSSGAFVTGLYAGEISDSYSTASIVATSASEDDYSTFAKYSEGTSLIYNTFSTGLLTHPDNHTNKGGSGDYGTLTNSYFNSTTTGQSSGSAGNTALTNAQFASSANFTGFDFTNVWSMQSDRPKLKWEDADVVAPTAPTFIFPNANNYPLGYTDINTIGTYEVEGRCAESQWPVRVVVTTPDGSYTSYEPCNLDSFWSHTVTLDNSWVDAETVTLVASQTDGAGNASSTATRILEVDLPTACVNNRATAPFAAGAGTVGNPYIICTETQFNAISSNTSWNQAGVYFNLGDSIDLNGAFTGLDLASRTGAFDGKNFRVFNGTYSGSGDYVSWLSSGVAGMAFSNFHLFSFSLTTSGTTLAPFGSLLESTSNLSFRGTLSGANSVGGLFTSVGVGVDASNLYVRANISGAQSVGGIADFFSGDNSVTDNTVRFGTLTSSSQRLGGLTAWIGTSTSASTFSNNRIVGRSIQATNNYVGGFVGALDTGSQTVTFADNEVIVGKISGTDPLGGFMGNITFNYSGSATFEDNSVEVGVISLNGNDQSGSGFLGSFYNSAAATFNRNRVIVNSISAEENVAGIIGLNNNNISHVLNENLFVGYLESSGTGSEYGLDPTGVTHTTNTDNYFDSRTSGTSASSAGTAKAAYEMYRQSTYSGFNFTPTTGDWKMPKNGGYPKLQWQYD